MKVRLIRSVGKKMVAAFFCKTGPVAIILLEDRRTVLADWCINCCLPKAFETWSLVALRPASEAYFFTTIMHLHTQQPQDTGLLAENSFQLVSHPPYGPDLAPCNFFLFPTIKELIRGVRFGSPEKAQLAFKEPIWTLLDEK